jgi:hypothetical protein
VIAQKSRPAKAAHPQLEDKSYSTVYPSKIVLTDAAETYIEQLAYDLVIGNVELHQLSDALLQFHAFAWNAGRNSANAVIDRLNHECDRLYMAAFNPVKIDHNRPTYAALERIRGNPERADQIEADMAKMFEGDNR